MVTYSPHPVFVDGVRLDSAAWNVESKVRTMPGARAADQVIPGVDGLAASINDDIESSTLTLSMWLLGTDGDGLIPGGSTAMAKCRDNLDQLAHLFGKRHALLDVQEVVDASGTQRQAWCKVVDAVEPVIRAGGLGRFTVSLLIPEGMWQDPATADWSQASAVASTVYEVTTLQGATGPISDAVVTVTGPVTNPQLNDFTTSAYVRLNAALAAGSTWRVNVGTWATRYGAGLSLASADTAGTDGQAVTVYGNGNARFLRLVPSLSTGARRVRLSLTGTGLTSATALGVRARRKFLQ